MFQQGFLIVYTEKTKDSHPCVKKNYQIFAKNEQKPVWFCGNLVNIFAEFICILLCLCYNICIEVWCFGTYIQPEKIGVLTICVKKK